MKGIHLCTAVWGKTFIKNYTTYTVPSFLAENNIPYLNSKKRIVYTVYTSTEGEKILNNSENFKRLSELCETNINTVIIDNLLNGLNENKELNKNKQNHSQNMKISNFCFSDCIKIANLRDEGFLLLHPDAIFSKNNLRNLLEYINKGYRVIYVPGGFRVSINKIHSEIQKFFSNDKCFLSISNSNLVNLSIKNILSKHKRSLYFNYIKTKFSFEVLLPIKNLGISHRAVVGQDSLFIYPFKKEINYDVKEVSLECSEFIDSCIYDEKDIILIDDSNVFYKCPIENHNEDYKDFEIFDIKNSNLPFKKPNSISFALLIEDYNKAKSTKNFIFKPIRYNLEEKNIDITSWKKFEKKTLFFSKKVFFYYSIFSKSTSLKKFGYLLVLLDQKMTYYLNKIILKIKTN